MRLCRSDDTPIFITRLVAETGGIIHGGLAHVGRLAVICASRSCTSWRTRSSSVPRSKMSWIEDSCATDFERISSRPGRPLSWFSIGTVMSSSTSSDELPRAIVWISTRGGANSGNTSTLACGISATPYAVRAAAANSTSQRNRRLWETTHRMSVTSGDVVLGAVHEAGALRHDAAARRRPVREDDAVAAEPVDDDVGARVGPRTEHAVHERPALGVVEQRGVWHDVPRPADPDARGPHVGAAPALGREPDDLRVARLDHLRRLVAVDRGRFDLGAAGERRAGEQAREPRGERA